MIKTEPAAMSVVPRVRKPLVAPSVRITDAGAWAEGAHIGKDTLEWVAEPISRGYNGGGS